MQIIKAIYLRGKQTCEIVKKTDEFFFNKTQHNIISQCQTVKFPSMRKLFFVLQTHVIKFQLAVFH